MANAIEFSSFLEHKWTAFTCNVDPMINAHLVVKTFSAITRLGPREGRLCINCEMAYKPKLKFARFTCLFGLVRKDGSLNFLAQNERKSFLASRAFGAELEEALHKMFHKKFSI